MKLFSILVVAVSVFGVSCERHEFEGPNGTKQLNESHAAGGGHEEAGESHAVHGETPAAHGETPAHGEAKQH